jgi:radical SAM superfamily enzyme YgiQ (UPF0313 family)
MVHSVKLHLISAPWSFVTSPSAQIGALKAYVDKEFGDSIETRAYSAHLGIFKYFPAVHPVALLWGTQNHHQEYVYFELLNRAEPLPRIDLAELRAELHDTFSGSSLPSSEFIRDLGAATDRYLSECVVPHLSKECINVIGFTLNFRQVFASLYIARWLRRNFPTHRFVTVYGGYGAIAPVFVKNLERLDPNGFRVVGEGERKLGKILETLQRFGSLGGEETGIPGVYPLAVENKILAPPESDFKSQIENISELPLPNFDDFFELLDSLKSSSLMFALGSRVSMPLEGSRGCFSKCDFCSLNLQWRGFRRVPAEIVYERAAALIEKYKCRQIFFVDTVSDSYAEKFSDLVTERGLDLSFFMELRAHHPQKFWTKLRRAGLQSAIIGAESLSQPLLDKISKGTKVIDNLRVQKYLSELGVEANNSLIFYHSKSTHADVQETRRIMEHTLHFPTYGINTLWIDAGSPIFDALSSEDKANLRPRGGENLLRLSDFYSLLNGYTTPKSLTVDPKLDKEWRELETWYQKAKSADRIGGLTQTELAEEILKISDTRDGKNIKILLKGDRARLYQACHAGPKHSALEELRIPAWESHLEWLMARRLVLAVGVYYLALALRTKKTLLEKEIYGGVRAHHVENALTR